MSGENKNNQPKAQGEQAQQRKQSRWRKGQHSVEPKKKDAEAIPILSMGHQIILPSLRKPCQKQHSSNMAT
jgi:hypothetical protein